MSYLTRVLVVVSMSTSLVLSPFAPAALAAQSSTSPSLFQSLTALFGVEKVKTAWHTVFGSVPPSSQLGQAIGGSPLFFDDFEYVISRDTNDANERAVNTQAFISAGWAGVKTLNTTPNAWAGYIYTVDSINGYSGTFPGTNSNRVLVLEAKAGTLNTQTDFYLQYGSGEGPIGQIPADHWFQFWVYVENTANHPSRFSTSQSKLLYLNRSTYYPATIDNQGYVYLASSLGNGGTPTSYSPCTQPAFGEWECDRAFIETKWNGSGGGISSNVEYNEDAFGSNLSPEAHIVPNQWTLVRLHVDVSGTDPRALPGQAVYEQWIKRQEDSSWTKTTEYFGGVTTVNGSSVSMVPAYTDGFRMVRIPTTVGGVSDARPDRFDYWVYLDDFVIAENEGDLPTYSITSSPTCTSFTYSSWGACQSNNTQTRTVQTSSPNGCTGGSPVTTQTCMYTAPAPVLSFSVSDTSITSGESTTLTWSTTNSTSCTASNGWSGSKSTSGSASVSPTTDTTYTLTCSGAGGSTAASVTVTVSAAPSGGGGSSGGGSSSGGGGGSSGGGGGGSSSKRATATTTTTTPVKPTASTTPAKPTLPAPSSSSFTFTLNLGLGAEGTAVTELQKRLRSEGFFTYPTNTGYFGPATAAAVQAYQKKHGIDATGFVGPMTRNVLNGTTSVAPKNEMDLATFVRLLIAVRVIPPEKATRALQIVEGM